VARRVSRSSFIADRFCWRCESFSSRVRLGTVEGVPGTVRLGEVDGVEWGSESRFGLSGSVWMSEGV